MRPLVKYPRFVIRGMRVGPKTKTKKREEQHPPRSRSVLFEEEDVIAAVGSIASVAAVASIASFASTGY